MALRNQLPPWHHYIALRNGRQVLIRPIRPDDALPLRAAFSLFEPQEVRQRFLPSTDEFTPEQAEAFCRTESGSEFVLVAAEPYPPGEALIGAVARLRVIPRSKDAELTILVGRYLNGMGLGRVLMQRLTRWARGKHLKHVFGDVQESNLPMLNLAKSLGFKSQPTQTAGLVRVVLDVESADISEDDTA